MHSLHPVTQQWHSSVGSVVGAGTGAAWAFACMLTLLLLLLMHRSPVSHAHQVPCVHLSARYPANACNG